MRIKTIGAPKVISRPKGLRATKARLRKPALKQYGKFRMPKIKL